MNLLPMYYFSVIVEKGSISRAAQELNITQQTMSAHVAAMEKELQCVLFRRRPRLELTYAGQKFYQYAVRFLKLYDAMGREFRDIACMDTGVIRVGVSFTRSRLFMPALIMEHQKKYPNVEVDITEDTNAVLQEKLKEGEIDVAIEAHFDEEPGICSRLLYEEEMLAAVPNALLKGDMRHRLEDGDLTVLQEMPFLASKSGDITGRIASALLKKYGVVARRIMVSENIATILRVCLMGGGACFVPDAMLYDLLSQEELAELTVVRTGERYPIRIEWMDKPYIQRTIEDFVNMTVQQDFEGLIHR